MIAGGASGARARGQKRLETGAAPKGEARHTAKTQRITLEKVNAGE
jgi:hypothetical protein